MEIQAKLSFKHGRIMRVIKSAGLSVKEMSMRCGWDYQSLLDFISFKRLSKRENREALLHSLQSLDATITEQDVFPELYNQVKGALHTRISIKDIPLENLLPCNPDIYGIEDHTETRVALKVDAERALTEIQGILSERQLLIINMYFGIGYDRPYNLGEIAEELCYSRENICIIKDKVLRKLALNSKMQKYKEIGDVEII